MANIPIWPGSSSFSAGIAAFGFYDEDTDFQADAPKVASWCAQRLGYPLVDIELQDKNFYTAFEEAITEYGAQVYAFQIRNNLGRLKGTTTGSEPLNNIYLDDYFGQTTTVVNQSSYNSFSTTGGTNLTNRLFSASLAVQAGKQVYNLLSSNAGYATGTIKFNSNLPVSSSIILRDTTGTPHTFTAVNPTVISSSLSSSDGGATFDTIEVIATASLAKNQFATGSGIITGAALQADLFKKVIDSGSSLASFFVNKDTEDTTILHVTQSVEGSGGDTTISAIDADGSPLESEVTITNFSGGTSGLSFEASGSAIQAGKKRINVKKIFHYQPAAINRYFDPYAGTGTGIQSLMQTFGFGNYSPGVNFMLMPMYFDALKLQAIELNDTIRKSGYHFTIEDNRYLRLHPIPNRDYTMYFEYQLKSVANNPVKDTTGGITNMSNVPYTNPTYKLINEPGRQWIRRYTLALAKEMLGSVRGKYQSVPIPGADTTLDFSRLLSEALSEKTALIEELKSFLEETTRVKQLERQNQEAQLTQETFYKVPYPIYIG